MRFCQRCGKEIMEEAIICPNCGCGTGVKNSFTNSEDEINVGLCIVSALIPLFGFIYWGIKSKETPRKAKACGITAIVAFSISLLFSVAGFIMSILMYM